VDRSYCLPAHGQDRRIVPRTVIAVAKRHFPCICLGAGPARPAAAAGPWPRSPDLHCELFIVIFCRLPRAPQSAGYHLTRSRFPPPWSGEELDAYFVVRDTNGQQRLLLG
jgi:hypothetical protein